MKLKQTNKLKNIFYVALAAVVCINLYMLASKNTFYFDATQNNQNSLSSTSLSLLGAFESPVTITLYTQDPDLSLQIKTILQPYIHASENIEFSANNSQLTPRQKKQFHFNSDGLVFNYRDQAKTINIAATAINEESITGILFKLIRSEERWVVFVTGHGEGDPYGSHNADFALFKVALNNQGVKLQTLNLAQAGVIPDNTSLLVVPSAKSAWLNGEQQLLKQYLDNGGNALILQDPNSFEHNNLYQSLGLKLLPGIIIDANGQSLGTPHPAITIINNYPDFASINNVKQLTAFPFAKAWEVLENSNWQVTKFLNTHPSSWTETGDIQGNIAFEPELGERAGPLTLGVSLTRDVTVNGEDKQQRVVVIGNSRFISNGAIENYGNLSLGLALTNWLNADDKLLSISQPEAVDVVMHVPNWLKWVYLYGFSLLVPALVLGGFWFSRRESV